MTRRERILRAFQHHEPDRVPFFEQGVASRVAGDILGRPALTGGGAFRFQATLAAYRGRNARAEFEARYLEDYADLAVALDFDLVSLPWTGGLQPTDRLDANTFRVEDQSAATWSIHRFDEASDTFQTIDNSFRREGIAAVERHVRSLSRRSGESPGPPDASVSPLEFLVQRFGRGTARGEERAVAAGVGIAVPLDQPWLEAMVLRPDLIDTYLGVQVEENLRGIDRLAELGVDVIWGGGDLAANQGPVYSPASLRRYILPGLKKMTERCHEHGLPYVFRSDGWLWPIAQELFVESDVDGYGEIDAQAGMRLSELKERLPNLTLWGNVDCAGALVTGTPAEVAAETRRCLDDGAPGGGFILGSSNVIHAHVRTRNFLEMVRTHQQYGAC